MAVEFATARSNNIFSIVLLSITVFFVIAVLIGLNVPFAGGGEASFVALGVIGGFGWAISEAQSTVRSVRHKKTTGKSYKLLKRPLTIAGMVLGTLALLVIIFTMNHVDIGFITGFSNAFIALAVLIFVLFGLNLRRNVVLS